MCLDTLIQFGDPLVVACITEPGCAKCLLKLTPQPKTPELTHSAAEQRRQNLMIEAAALKKQWHQEADELEAEEKKIIKD